MSHDLSLARRAVVEGVATALLLAAVVGSGIMGETLARGDDAMALLANSLATGAALAAILFTFGPLSGAHLNPVVSLAAAAQRELPWRDALAYVGAQAVGAIGGVVVANAMFGHPAIELSRHQRLGWPLALAEGVATFGLLLVVRVGSRARPQAVPVAVAAYITGAYWFTSSTSFANPAVTVARAFSDSFAGIHIGSVPGFVVAQVAGAVAATALAAWLARPARPG